jgi:hypothetical protein
MTRIYIDPAKNARIKNYVYSLGNLIYITSILNTFDAYLDKA